MSEHDNRENHNGSGTVEKLIYMPAGRSITLDPASIQGGKLGSQQILPREIQFAELSSGSLVDLILGPDGALELLVYRDGVGTHQHSIVDDGIVLMPPSVDRSLINAIRWPSFLDGDDTPRSLIRDITKILNHYVQLDDADYDIVAYFALSTWFSDLSRFTPYLSIIGAYSCGKTTLLRLLSAICRRPALVADLTPAALYSLCSSLHPTLLLDEFDLHETLGDRSLMRLLRNGSNAGQKVLRAKMAYDVFGPKVLVSRHGIGDAALASRALVVTMRPTTRNNNMPSLDDATLHQIAGRLQNRLFGFRLRNYRLFKPPVLAANDLTPRMRDIARTLTIPLLGDPELEAEVLEHLRPHDIEAKLQRRGEPEWVVATALLSVCHQGTSLLSVGEITLEVDEVLDRQGETYRLAPRKVGDILRSIGIASEGIGNRGRGLRLSQTVLRLIHQTARDMGLTRVDILDPHITDGGLGGYPCELCEEFGLMVDANARKLRCLDRRGGKRPRPGLFD